MLLDRVYLFPACIFNQKSAFEQAHRILDCAMEVLDFGFWILLQACESTATVHIYHATSHVSLPVDVSGVLLASQINSCDMTYLSQAPRNHQRKYEHFRDRPLKKRWYYSLSIPLLHSFPSRCNQRKYYHLRDRPLNQR